MKHTRKKILAMILALVMAMAVTASAANDTIDETDLSQYTVENSRHAIRNGYINGNSFAFNPDGSAKDGYSNPKEPKDSQVDTMTADPAYADVKTAVGNIRETWDYLYDNFCKPIADNWFQATKSNIINQKNAESVMLDYLLSGNADRHFAYTYKNFGFYEAWNIINSVTKTTNGNGSDENTMSFENSRILQYGPKKGNPNGTAYISTEPDTKPVTTPEPTVTQPVNNTQTGTAPITVTPGEVMTVTVNGIPMQLEAVVITDANGGATTYFKLRDVGNAVGFRVDWTAETGITVNSK